MASFGQGDAVKDLFWIIGVIVALGLAWFVLGGPQRFQNSLGSSSTPGSFFGGPPNILPGATSSVRATSSSEDSSDNVAEGGTFGVYGNLPNENGQEEPRNPGESRFKDKIQLRLGESNSNANLEYVVLESSYPEPIDITGWRIGNGGNEKMREVNGRVVRNSSIVVSIPNGTEYMNGKTASRIGRIKLSSGGTAFIFTGAAPRIDSYRIDTSFRINKCTGYLFTSIDEDKKPSSMSYHSCPDFDDEVRGTAVSETCYNEISSRYGSSCLTPKEDDGDSEEFLVDGVKLTPSCRKILFDNFNYSACLTKHKNDKDFLTDSWQIYLNRGPWGIYYPDRATITLYDQLGKVVSTYKY